MEGYHVGWICALNCEFAAAKAMLDEEHITPVSKDPYDSNNYALGTIHNHKVAIACLPSGRNGTNAAAVVATNLLRTFPNVKFGLMVGIGAGIPDLDNDVDIRLGDIVVSQPTATTGGVVQYDKGKSLADGTFQITGFLNSPPTALLTALQHLQAQHDMTDSKAPEYLEQAMKRYPKMTRTGYLHPGSHNDHLHCDECIRANSTCPKCDQGRVRRRTREFHTPEIHYGIVASGNQVVKDAVERDLS